MKKCHLIVLMPLLLTSCASASPIALSNLKTFPAGEAVVFGRVQLVSMGRILELKEFGLIAPRLIIVPDGTGRAVPYDLSGDGSFSWQLLPGRYSIAAFHLGKWQERVFARFVVPDATPLVYIGTLVIGFEEGLRFMIEDDYEWALRSLKGKFPDLAGPTRKSLMQLEKPR